MQKNAAIFMQRSIRLLPQGSGTAEQLFAIIGMEKEGGGIIRIFFTFTIVKVSRAAAAVRLS